MRRTQRLQILILAIGVLSLGEFVHAQVPGERCEPHRNPHSFACQDATFRGQVFPMKPADPARMAGAWRARLAVTHGGEFRTLFNPQAPAKLLGVQNLRDGSRMGSMVLRGNGAVSMADFGRSGVSLTTVPGSVSLPDRHTLQFQMTGDGRRHGFQCRIFDRKNLTHILCRWQVAQGGKFVQAGYLGFIR